MRHPSNEQIEHYALGTLELTLRLLVETHLDYCSSCEAKVKEIRNVSLATPFDEGYIPPPPGSPKAESADALLESIMNNLPELDLERGVAQEAGMKYIPQFLQDDILPSDHWKWASMWPVEGKIGTILEDKVSGYSLYLAYFKAGSKAPKHQHLSDEYTVMLKGGYTHGDKHVTVGDWDWEAAGSTHAPLVDDTEDCWCIVRSKTKKSVAFKGIDSWRQPFVKLSELRG